MQHRGRRRPAHSRSDHPVLLLVATSENSTGSHYLLRAGQVKLNPIVIVETNPAVFASRHRGTVSSCALAIALFLASCGNNQDRAQVTVSVAEDNVKFGHDMDLRVDHAPEGWSGEVSVNNFRHIPIDASRLSVRVTRQNGFDPAERSDLFVVLLDRNGHELSVADQGRLSIQAVPTAVSLSPASDTVGPDERSGLVRVGAPPDYAWKVQGLPQWMKLIDGGAGAGPGTIGFKVEANTSQQGRSAAVPVGDAVFEITQMAAVAAPLRDTTAADTFAHDANSQGLNSAKAPPSSAIVTLDKNVVRFGGELRVRVENVPQIWSGEVLVNSLRHVSFDSQEFVLKATVRNGFNELGPTDLYFLLSDQKGRELPLANGGRFRVNVTPSAVKLDMESRIVKVEGVSGGKILVAAARDTNWSVEGVPDWIRINSGAKGSGDGTVVYTVDENTTNHARKATLTIGDATCEFSQARPIEIQIPYHDDFRYSTPPTPIWIRALVLDSTDRWTVDEPGGKRATWTIANEAPKGGRSVLIQKAADPRAWATQMILPSIAMKVGNSYTVALWMKAEMPGPVSITFGQSTEPYQSCGLSHTFQVTDSWAEYKAPFRVSGSRCEPANNRLSIQVGQIGGKLWIAGLSMTAAR